MEKKQFTKPDINLNLVLPKHYYRAEEIGDGDQYSDKYWITDVLNAMTVETRNSSALRYSALYLQAHEAEPVEHKKDNRARFCANTFLRETLEEQVATKKSALYLPEPNSWEIIATLRLFPEKAEEFSEWKTKYESFLQKRKYRPEGQPGNLYSLAL